MGQKITIGPNDYLTWGKLVKTWATGRNYVDHNSTEVDPVPKTGSISGCALCSGSSKERGRWPSAK